MAYLMHICFDNSHRLLRKHYLFEYRDVRFKLVQGKRRKWADHLLTVLPQNDHADKELAFFAASEFLSALAWENRARVAVWEAGGRGWPAGDPLQDAEPNIFVFPRIPFSGNIVGFDLTRIPHVQTESQRIALTLFREANASNNDYLSFLFYWQVLEVDGGNAPGFVNRTFRKCGPRLQVQTSDINRLPLGGRSLGHYLLDDCRDAIAHIRRRPGKRTLDLDKPDERMRLAISARVVKAFAEHYIGEVLGLTNHLYLVRRKRGDFPTFVDRKMLESGHFKPAYPGPRHLTRAWSGRAKLHRSHTTR